MKIARIMGRNGPQYGLVEGGRIILCGGDPFTGLQKGTESVDFSKTRLLPPVDPPNIVCIGLNYRKHAKEGKNPIPKDPLIFLKATTSLSGPGDPIVLPKRSPDRIDCEAELAVVIGKRAKEVSEGEALDFVLGYTIGNDVSNKAAQRADGQWVRGKSYDSFCPLGPVLVTDVDPRNLDIECRIDGEIRQSSNTSDMIFSCSRLVSYISTCMTLLPGTVILTGTPEGLGSWRNPPVFLKAGQVVEIEISKIGVLSNHVTSQD
jgi:2-keto-4-pentenoate hydratase/2-oxohepta-3-ene-1,7-dioic acid hydratase in catechol pathway